MYEQLSINMKLNEARMKVGVCSILFIQILFLITIKM